MNAAPVQFVEAAPAAPALLAEAIQPGARSGTYRVRVIAAGLSKNNTLYPAAVLRTAAHMFEGARVFAKSDREHLAGEGKDVRNLIGGLSAPVFVEGATPGEGEIQADMSLIIGDADPLSVKLREAVAKNLTGLFGLSIAVEGAASAGPRGTRIAESFGRVHSVDLIVEPGAGGQVISFTEAAPVTRTTMDRDALLALIKAANPKLLEGKDEAALTMEELQAILSASLAPASPAATMTEAAAALKAMSREEIIGSLQAVKPDSLKDKDLSKISDDELRQLLGTALTPPAPEKAAPATTPPAAPAAGTETPPAPVTAEATAQMVEAAINRRTMLSTRLNACGLPQPSRDRIAGEFGAKANFTEAELTIRIADEGRYLAGLGVAGGTVQGLGFQVGDGPREKGANMIEAFFDPTHKDHKDARSIKDVYITLTGDTKVTGRMPQNARFTEALNTTTFAAVLGNSITRRLIADYRTVTEFDIYRPLTGTPVPLSDFRTQERTRFGGYGDLPKVAEAGPYVALASPTDEKATYAPEKRGGTETVTLEMIKNDDVGAVQRIPTKLSRAAKRTLGKFVLDFIRLNPAIYDTKTLFHADHGNLSTAALSAASYAAARLAMVKQKEFGTDDAIGVGPKYLWIPPELEEAATNLFVRNTNVDKTFVQTLAPTIVPVWYWSDANDWAISADPADIPTIELGFLDGNEEPEVFVQDNPNVGSFFTNDQITYKIRHIYGAAVVDFRGMAKAVVA